MAGGDLSVSDYYELQDILSFFPEKYYKINGLFSEIPDSRTLDELFRAEVVRTYVSKINNLAIPIELKNKLLNKIGNYITNYSMQRSQKNIERFYVQNWKILIQKLF